jgi:hypothetical protein
VVNFRLRPVYPGERDTGTFGIVGWVDPRADLYISREEILLPVPGFETRTVQSVAW